jgi:hypothetical protein
MVSVYTCQTTIRLDMDMGYVPLVPLLVPHVQMVSKRGPKVVPFGTSTGDLVSELDLREV